MKQVFFILGLSVLWFSCNQMNAPQAKEGDILLATAYNKALYLSELDGMLPKGSTKEDSTLTINAYVERWVQEHLLMHEAEKNIPQDVDVDALVREYRASLIMHTYEKLLFETELDSTISAQELNQFYEAYKDQYHLDNTIIRCDFIKIANTATDLGAIGTLWTSTETADRISLTNLCYKNAEIFKLNQNKWHDVDQILQYLPKGLIGKNTIANQKNFVHQDNTHKYFLRVLETVSGGQSAPFSYIETQARQAILKKRKKALLQDKKAALYEQEPTRKNVQIYNQ